MSTRRGPRRGEMVAALAALLVLGSSTSAADGLAEKDYRSLTNTFRSFTNFNVEVVRGMVTDGGINLYAVNAYESTLVHHEGILDPTTPTHRWRTVSNPVSVAYHQVTGNLFVVGQGNHALARHDRFTGRIIDLIMLGSEPADIVLDEENGWAFVSCMGSDEVWQIDIDDPTGMSVVNVWNRAKDPAWQMKRPSFLSFDPGTPGDPTDNVVYVAPLISGNNTFPVAGPIDGTLIADGTEPAIFPPDPVTGIQGLPDFDLFRIRPTADVVEPVIRGAGSIMLGHALNTFDGAYWMLNVDHQNFELQFVGEPGARGIFAFNRLTRIPASNFPAAGAPWHEADLDTEIIDIDDNTPADQVDGTPWASRVADYDASTSLPFPYAMDFDENTGWAAIASSTSPIITLFDQNGQRFVDIDASGGVNTGDVIRSLEFITVPGATFLLAYCQQTSNVLLFSIIPFVPNATQSFSLGNDPTPDAVATGRGTWYDASNSAHGRTTCNHCHPQGGAEALVWNISDFPVDSKGPMVTQTLKGIEDTFPYHWRGERDLRDFNVAFPGLLGADDPLDETPGGQLDLFDEFIFSLRPPANPKQDLDRKLKDVLTPELQGVGLIAAGTELVGDPTMGETIYHDDNVNTDGNGDCESCHTNPTGTNSDFAFEVTSHIAHRANMDVTALHNELVLKDQPIVDVLFQVGVPPVQSTLPAPLLGAGTEHTGVFRGLFDFNNRIFGPPGGALSAQDVADVTAFVSLFDNTTAPSVHWATQLRANSSPQKVTDIQTYLLDQAAKRWVGVVVIGDLPAGATNGRVHWMYDAEADLFIPDREVFPLFPGGTPGDGPGVASGGGGGLAGDGGSGAGTILVGGIRNKLPKPPPPLEEGHTFTELQTLADQGATLTFLGVPPGNEERLGIDFDNDGLKWSQEKRRGTDPWNPDTDGDGADDGDEIANGSIPLDDQVLPVDNTPPALVDDVVTMDFKNAASAKFFFESDEPARWTITLSTPGGIPLDVVNTRYSFDTRHTAMVHRLLPGTVGGLKTNTYTGSLVLTDRAGNSSAPIPITPFDTDPMLPEGGTGALFKVIVRDLCLSNESSRGVGPDAFTYGATASMRIAHKEQSPPWIPAADQVVVGQLLKLVDGIWEVIPSGEITSTLDHATGLPAPDDFIVDANGTPTLYSTFLPGPFIVLAPTPGSGIVTVDYDVTGLTAADQEVMFNVVAVIQADPGHDPQNPSFIGEFLGQYQVPATPKVNRNIERGTVQPCP